jgi:hypothetical protein
VVIAPLTRAEADELLAVRQELDLLAARLAAAQMTPDELARARQLVARQDDQEAVRYLREAGILVAAGGLLTVNRAFHRMVYCGSCGHTTGNWTSTSPTSSSAALRSAGIGPAESRPLARQLHGQPLVCLGKRRIGGVGGFRPLSEPAPRRKTYNNRKS